MPQVTVQKAKADEAVKIIIDETTKAETYIVNEATAKTFNDVTAIDKKFATAINKFSNAISFDERVQQGKDWNACLATIRTVNEKATGKAVFNIACAIDKSIVKLKEKIGDENYIKLVDARGKNAKLVTILEANTDIKTETVNWKNAFNLTQDEATKLSTGRLLNINRALNKKKENAEAPKPVTAFDLWTAFKEQMNKHSISMHQMLPEMLADIKQVEDEDLQKQLRDIQEDKQQKIDVVNTANAKAIHEHSKQVGTLKRSAKFVVNQVNNSKLEQKAQEQADTKQALTKSVSVGINQLLADCPF